MPARTAQSDGHRTAYLEKQVSSVIIKLVTSVQPVLRMMRQSGEALVVAGKAGLFTRLAFWNATKPVQCDSC